MTCHQLIRCSLPQAVTAAEHQIKVPVRIEDHREGRRVCLRWHHGGPWHLIDWTLEIEQGANGVLAHLSAEPARGPLVHIARRDRHVALHLLVSRRLTRLAAGAGPTNAPR